MSPEGLFRRELLDPTSQPASEEWRVGRHVIQQRPGEEIEFFYIWAEGGMKYPPRMTSRVSRWYDKQIAELKTIARHERGEASA